MLRNITFTLFIIFALQACHSNSSNENKDSIKTANTNLIAGSDSLITTPCAVLIHPDDRRIKVIQVDTADGDEGTNDYLYYMDQSVKYLDSLKVKQLKKESKGEIAFKTTSGKVFRMKLDSMYWGVILFNGKSKPIDADITDIKLDYKAYMKK